MEQDNPLSNGDEEEESSRKLSSEENIVSDKHEVDDNSTNQKVTLTRIDMSFGHMVEFMVKWGLASIPALIIILTILIVLSKYINQYINN